MSSIKDCGEFVGMTKSEADREFKQLMKTMERDAKDIIKVMENRNFHHQSLSFAKDFLNLIQRHKRLHIIKTQYLSERG